MFIEERQRLILNKLDQEGRISVNDLVEEFDVSIDTIRRDLVALEKKSLLKRTHGGAIPATKVRDKPRYKTVKDMDQEFDHYKRIAKKACEYINKDDTIFLGGTSIHYIILKYLPTDINFGVITNSIVLAEELRERNNIDVFLVGGKLRKSGIVIDAAASELIRQMRIDINFASPSGVAAKYGLSNSIYETSTFDKIVVESSKKTICLTPHNKLGLESFVKYAEVEVADVVITDEDSIEDEIEKLREKQIEVIVV